MGIKAKILIPGAILTLVVAAAILVSNIVLFSGFVDISTIDKVNSTMNVALNSLEAIKGEVEAQSLSIAADPAIIDALAAGRRDDVLARAMTLRGEAGIDFVTVADAEGTVMARTHEPELYGDSVASQANVRSAMHGEALTALEEGSAVRLSVRAGTPVYDEGGRLLGVVSVGYRLDTDRFVDLHKKMTGCELNILSGDERIASTLLREDGSRAVGTKADPRIARMVLAGQSYSGRANLLGRTAVAKYIPLDGPDGRPIGMIFVGQYIEEETKTIMAFVKSALIITGIMMAASIMVILLVAGHIVEPIQAMTRAASALAVGDTDLDIKADTNDEMRTLADAFNSMIENTRRQVRTLEHIAAGDLTLTLSPRSEKDLMNRALEKLNATIKAQAAKIQEEHRRLRILLDATPMASRLWSRDYRLIDCNEEAVKLFGFKNKREYLERHLELSPEYQSDGQPTRETIMGMVREAFEKGARNYYWTYTLLDGTELPCEVKMVRVPYGDDYVVAAYSRDMREQNAMMAEIRDTSAQLETALTETRAANRAKSAFLAHMSHEIRTPLNAVVGLSELALDYGGLEDEMKDRLEIIRSSGLTILYIINDILDISKIESGKFELFNSNYDIPSLLNDIVTLNIVRIGEKPVTFKFHVDENLPGKLFGDELRVKQIFNNLLSNAFKYTNSGTVEWRVSHERDQESVWLLATIRDTGIGIKPEALQKLFLDYNQADMEINRKIEGTGLGLAITRNLVDMMDGSITVESEYGQGTTFQVRLRQAFVSAEPIGPAVAANLMSLRYMFSKRHRNRKPAHVNLSYAHVLVVDDIATNLDVVKGMLKPYGIKIDCAAGGRQAIDLIRAENPRYSAVFMDHMMPDLDGIEAARIIREEIGTDYARGVPIIALTANAIVGNEEMFLSRGFQDFISKPIDTVRLDSVLRRWVRDKNLEKELEETEKPDAGRSGAEHSLLAGLAIDGLDARGALKRFNDDEGVLLDVLRSYVSGARLLLGDLRDYLAADNFHDYIIAVHGIKGSSYGIFAREVGYKAEELESAARAGHFDAVRAGHSAFEKSLESLLESIGLALAEIDAAADKPLCAAPAPALLDELREACAAFDMDRADAAMTKLESFRYSCGTELIAWLRAKFNKMAFEEIAGPPPERMAGFGQADGPDFTAPEAEILVVDDNEMNLKAARGLLAPLQMRVDTAESGEEALRMIRAKQYHLIFMDHLMPRMDGIETTRQLRLCPGGYYQKAPVIALTADETRQGRESFLLAGMNDFVAKPIDLKEISAAIRRWLPAGLLRRQPPPAAPPERGAEEWADMPPIQGIDARAGLRHSGGKKAFAGLLGNFHTLIDLKSAGLEACLAAGRLRDLVIEAHALKNAAGIIGAGELAEAFGRLELYGNEGDRAALDREMPDVLEQYRSFKARLSPFGERAGLEKKAASERELVALLRELKSSMNRFDLDGADETLRRLEELRMPGEARDMMETLRAHVADVAAEEAVKTAEAMIETIVGIDAV